MALTCCPKSIKACAVRFTRLQPSGMPYNPLNQTRTIQGSGFAELTLSPDYEEGEKVDVRSPGGELAVIHRDFDALRGFDVSLRLCGLPLMLDVLGLNPLVDPQSPNPEVPLISGFALTDSLAHPTCDPWMLELWSRNAASPNGIDDCPRWIHWVLPYTSHWTLSSDLSFTTGALEVEISGYARQNEWWFPAFPGAEFPSYIEDLPIGSPPTELPEAVTRPDEWTIYDVLTIRASGPLAWKCVAELPEPLDDCAYVWDLCNRGISWADGPFQPTTSPPAPPPPVTGPYLGNPYLWRIQEVAPWWPYWDPSALTLPFPVQGGQLAMSNFDEEIIALAARRDFDFICCDDEGWRRSSSTVVSEEWSEVLPGIFQYEIPSKLIQWRWPNNWWSVLSLDMNVTTDGTNWFWSLFARIWEWEFGTGNTPIVATNTWSSPSFTNPGLAPVSRWEWDVLWDAQAPMDVVVQIRLMQGPATVLVEDGVRLTGAAPFLFPTPLQPTEAVAVTEYWGSTVSETDPIGQAGYVIGWETACATEPETEWPIREFDSTAIEYELSGSNGFGAFQLESVPDPAVVTTVYGLSADGLGNNEVRRWDIGTGTTLSAFYSLPNARRLATRNTGDVFVVCDGGGAFQLDAGLTTATPIPGLTSLNAPCVAWSSSTDNVWITELSSGVLTKVDPTTLATTTYLFSGVADAITTGGGYVWISDSTNLIRVDETTGLSTTYPWYWPSGWALNNPGVMRFDSGYLYCGFVAGPGGVLRFDTTTNTWDLSWIPTLPTVSQVTSLATYQMNEVWVGAYAPGVTRASVWRISTNDGSVLQEVVGLPSGLNGETAVTATGDQTTFTPPEMWLGWDARFYGGTQRIQLWLPS